MQPPEPQVAQAERPGAIVAVPLRHPGRWVAAVLLIALAVALGWSLATNKNVDHATIGDFLFNDLILKGALISLGLTIASMALGTLLAVIIAVMYLSDNPVLKVFATFYIWFFRATPLLVQITFWGYLGLLYPKLFLGIPGTGLQFGGLDTNKAIPAIVAGLLALTLNEGAYAAEIVRAGIMSVDVGQREAAASLGMSPGFTMRKIVLPQAMRIIIPPIGNETISMLKNTSLLYVLGIRELYTAASQISSGNLKQVELLVVASAWYIVITTLMSIPQHYLEKRYGRGVL